MSKLIRYFLPGQSCFVTSVTAHREPLLVRHADLLVRAAKRAGDKFDFKIVAWVVMPDHFHLALRTPNGDTAKVMRSIKLSFSGQYRSRSGFSGPVWQHRYWDHILRSEEDMNRHLDYIHFNPVKHGLVDSPRDYSMSSFKRFCREGRYDLSWRKSETEFGDCEYGE